MLENESKETLQVIYLSKTITYKIAPSLDMNTSEVYQETLKAFKMLNISTHQEILQILSIILNLGNIRFHTLGDIFAVSVGTSQFQNSHPSLFAIFILDSCNFIKNVAKLLKTDINELLKVLTSRIIYIKHAEKRRQSVYFSPCLNKSECEDRRNCMMRFLYEKLFLWLVRRINDTICKEGIENFLGNCFYLLLCTEV